MAKPKVRPGLSVPWPGDYVNQKKGKPDIAIMLSVNYHKLMERCKLLLFQVPQTMFFNAEVLLNGPW